MLEGKLTSIDATETQEKWPSVGEQHARFVKTAWAHRSPELLATKVDEFLQIEGLPPTEVQKAYEEQKKLLTELFGDKDGNLKNELLFHGTGKLKYSGQKYDKNGPKNETTPALETILTEGLNPHYDQWILDKDVETVSLAQNYFYAKCYAAKNMREKDELKWQLGNPDDFFIFFLTDFLKRDFELKHLPVTMANLLVDAKKILETLKARRSARGKRMGLSRWFSGFVKCDNKFRDYNDLLASRTDIPGNWGAVICLKNDLITFPMKYGGAHEVRTENNVQPNKFKAIGVPLRRMHEAQLMLEKAGLYDVKLFALECADMHLANFPVKDLVARVEEKQQLPRYSEVYAQQIY